MSESYNSKFSNGAPELKARTNFNFTSSSTGKKMFEWTVSLPGLEKPVVVEIKSYNNGGEIWFEAFSQSIKEKMRDTDIVRLKDAVESYLEERASLFTGIEWKDWLEVVVSGDNCDFSNSSYSSLGADLKINVRRLKRGVVPGTGRVVTISHGRVVDWPDPKSLATSGQATEGGIRIDAAEERSYVPETEENVAAVRMILSKMAELRSSIAGFLSQNEIERSLARGTVPALPGK